MCHGGDTCGDQKENCVYSCLPSTPSSTRDVSNHLSLYRLVVWLPPCTLHRSDRDWRPWLPRSQQCSASWTWYFRVYLFIIVIGFTPRRKSSSKVCDIKACTKPMQLSELVLNNTTSSRRCVGFSASLQSQHHYKPHVHHDDLVLSGILSIVFHIF